MIEVKETIAATADAFVLKQKYTIQKFRTPVGVTL